MAKTEKKNKGGRPAHEPTLFSRRQVMVMAAVGTRYVDIARVMELHPDTLAKYYGVELANGKMEINRLVGQVAVKKALAGDTRLIMFWLRTQAGWKEAPQTLELTGADGGPIESRVELARDDLRDLDAGELARLYHQAARSPGGVLWKQ